MDEPKSHSGLAVFVHIPKTAGLTLNSILAHQYAPGERYCIHTNQYSPERVRKLRRRRRLLAALGLSLPSLSFSKICRLKVALRSEGGLRLIYGHCDLSLRKFLPSDARYFTLLRDPVERAISHYYHYRKMDRDSIHGLAMRSSLSEWVGNCGLVEMDNGQTRRLAGETNLPCGQVTNETLARAKANLAQFAVIGLTERFEESQILLHREFGWPLYRYMSRNVGANRVRRNELHPKVLQTIERCNSYDIELYQFAAQLFERAVRKIDIAAQLALLNTAPQYCDPA